MTRAVLKNVRFISQAMVLDKTNDIANIANHGYHEANSCLALVVHRWGEGLGPHF